MSNLFKVFYPCSYTLLVIHSSLYHGVLHSGTYLLCLVCVFDYVDKNQSTKGDYPPVTLSFVGNFGLLANSSSGWPFQGGQRSEHYLFHVPPDKNEILS